MKFIFFLMLLASLSAAGQDSLNFSTFIISPEDSVRSWKIYKAPDTVYGSAIIANCAGCMVQSRPAIVVTASGEMKIRSWCRRFLFGRIKYHYSLPKKNWVLISFVPCK